MILDPITALLKAKQVAEGNKARVAEDAQEAAIRAKYATNAPKNPAQTSQNIESAPNLPQNLEKSRGIVRTSAIMGDSQGSGAQGGDDVDFSAFFIPSNASQTPKNSYDSIYESQDEPTAQSYRTGIESLDEKIANNKLSMFDYYVSKNYLGIDMNLMINGNLNLNQKIANTTKATHDIYETLKSLELGDEIIDKAQNNSGAINGIRRWLNHKSEGVISLPHELAQTDNLATTYAYAIARALGNGKTNLEQQKDAKIMNAFKGKSPEENTSRMGQNQAIMLTYLKNQIAEAQAQGARVHPSVFDKLKEYEDKISYIDANNGKIDIKTYQNIGNYNQKD